MYEPNGCVTSSKMPKKRLSWSHAKAVMIQNFSGQSSAYIK
jgi:hypothetical protein